MTFSLRASDQACTQLNGFMQGQEVCLLLLVIFIIMPLLFGLFGKSRT